jgi:hypothetical protein
LKRDIRRQSALDKKRAHIEKTIQEGLKNAKKTGDDKKFKMVATRQMVWIVFLLLYGLLPYRKLIMVRSEIRYAVWPRSE